MFLEFEGRRFLQNVQSVSFAKRAFCKFFVFGEGGNELKVVIDLVDTLVNCLKFCHLVTDDNLHTDSQKGKRT